MTTAQMNRGLIAGSVALIGIAFGWFVGSGWWPGGDNPAHNYHAYHSGANRGGKRRQTKQTKKRKI